MRTLCMRCGHSWYARSEHKPRYCPACRSVYWDRTRRAESTQTPGPQEDALRQKLTECSEIEPQVGQKLTGEAEVTYGPLSLHCLPPTGACPGMSESYSVVGFRDGKTARLGGRHRNRC